MENTSERRQMDFPGERRVFRQYLESLFVAVVIAITLRAFVLAAYKIPTGSMSPTLKIGDCIFAWKLSYGVRIPFTKILLTKPRLPNRGDVIVFRYPEDESLSFVKRVVGLPGDKIQIRQKRLFINDKVVKYGPGDERAIKDLPSKESYMVEKEYLDGKGYTVLFRRGEDDDSYGPEVVPPERLFVLGDNRDASDDSRAWGMVPLENLEGRAVFIWGSWDWERRFKTTGFPKVRTERLLTFIH